MSLPARRILEHLSGQRDEMCALLGRLAEVESPSTEPSSQEPMLDLLEAALQELGLLTRRLAGRQSGGALYARAPRAHGQRFQLVLGHADTVWPRGTLQQMPVRRTDGALAGPGVYDMKGGLAQMVFALRALGDLELVPSLTPVILVNTDEEIGSRESTRHIRRLARLASRALVLEPSLGIEGRLKTARKGVGRFEVRIEGRAAHAGLDPIAGASAILELSHQVQRLYEINDASRGITVNVGQIAGGVRPNVVAPTSSAVVDVRVPSRVAAAGVERALARLAPVLEGTRITVEGSFGRPPMEPTPANRVLWRQAGQAARDLGVPLEEGRAGGASDGNTTSQYTATLDGLGAVGDGAHAPHEHVRIDKLAERAALLALLLLAPAVQP